MSEAAHKHALSRTCPYGTIHSTNRTRMDCLMHRLLSSRVRWLHNIYMYIDTAAMGSIGFRRLKSARLCCPCHIMPWGLLNPFGHIRSRTCTCMYSYLGNETGYYVCTASYSRLPWGGRAWGLNRDPKLGCKWFSPHAWSQIIDLSFSATCTCTCIF